MSYYNYIPICIIVILSTIGLLCIIIDIIFFSREDDGIVFNEPQSLEASVIIDIDNDYNIDIDISHQDYACDLLIDEDSLFTNDNDSLT